MVAFSIRALSLLLCMHQAACFLPTSANLGPKRSHALEATRRSFVENLAVSSLAGLAVVQTANASGGATAGGVYLLSAKQRYNDRVTSGVKGFLNIQKSLESEDIDAVRTYFTSEEAGSWKDLSAAGYLLANAFRQNSTTPPDSIPAVKVCI
jgi:hypothetical protein